MLTDLRIGQAAGYALFGYGVVFLGLFLLMLSLLLLGKLFTAKKKTAVPAPVPVTAAPLPPAPGSAGRLKLYNVEPKTAAMLMAIVAHKLGKPVNELRFISIKEISE